MKCPRCNLFNPPSAERCDCGHAFVANPSPRKPSNHFKSRIQSEFDNTPVITSADSLINWARTSLGLGSVAMIAAILIAILNPNVIGFTGAGAVFGTGLILVAQGTLLMAGGRMISCLAAIERNTRGQT
jgi:hypothetical protein